MIIVTIETDNGAFIGRGQTVEEAYVLANENYQLSKIDKKGPGMWEPGSVPKK